ncbi:MAG: 6-bladed beta-propeller [Gemmatimonadaceae bacterium]
MRCSKTHSLEIARKSVALFGISLWLGVSALSAQTVAWTKSYVNPARSVNLADAQPRFDLNGAGELEFTRVRTIVPQSDGSFIVANGATNKLRVFDAQGKFVSRTGRKGNGPGEYTTFTAFATLLGDSLAVLDGFARRISILAKNGVFVRSIPVVQAPSGLGSAANMMALPSGALLVGFSEVSRMAPQPNAIMFYERYFTINSVTGALAPTDIRAPQSEHFVQAAAPERGGVAYWDLAFGKKASVRGSRSGFIVADAASWSIEQHGPNGAVAGTHRVARAVQPLTDSEREDYRKRELASVKGNDGGVTEKMIAEMPYPKNKPAYARVEVERGSDRLWVQTYAPEADKQNEWLRLDPPTSIAEAATMPPRFRPLAFTPTLVYGVWRDDDDVEHVRVYSLSGMRK